MSIFSTNEIRVGALASFDAVSGRLAPLLRLLRCDSLYLQALVGSSWPGVTSEKSRPCGRIGLSIGWTRPFRLLSHPLKIAVRGVRQYNNVRGVRQYNKQQRGRPTGRDFRRYPAY
jgi:hypothetical protein